jgi:hypothetical protein
MGTVVVYRQKNPYENIVGKKMIKKVEKSLHIVQFVEYFIYFCVKFACSTLFAEEA